MEELIKDIQSEHYTRKEAVVYGVLCPLALVVACVLGELLENF